MIPKIIHYVWLSGENIPSNYQKCLDSWKKHMGEFEYKMWSVQNLPSKVLNHPFVHNAIKSKKWAFATDFIRLWALYNYGGIYLDLDVEVYKSFEPFLKHSAFTDIEFHPNVFYPELRKGKKNKFKGLNIEAAILGAEKQNIWIKEILDFYNTLTFENKRSVLDAIIMPRIITQISLKYGFKYIPLYQVLDNDVHIYPPDVFTIDNRHCENPAKWGGVNIIKYSAHLCAHGWYEPSFKEKIVFNIKRRILNLIGKEKIEKLKSILLNK